jgi:hypothetical protein
MNHKQAVMLHGHSYLVPTYLRSSASDYQVSDGKNHSAAPEEPEKMKNDGSTDGVVPRKGARRLIPRAGSGEVDKDENPPKKGEWEEQLREEGR